MASPSEVDDEAVAEALRIFLEHERYSRSDAMREVLIWARQHFSSAYRETTLAGLPDVTYVTVVVGGGGGGTEDGIEDYDRSQRSGCGSDGGDSIPFWFRIS